MDTSADPDPTTGDVVQEAGAIVAGLSRAEKISLMSGADFWHGPACPVTACPRSC